MHIHILGICGTFMGGVAALARASGIRVTGCDANVYPPMSEQLAALGIEAIEGYGAEQRALRPDAYVVGNVVTRGNALMEAILDAGERYVSGPQWLAENVLGGLHVLAVAGTHGKTTTASMLAWILEQAGVQPGFLIGGVARDFGVSARPAGAPCAAAGGRGVFVIEADEYDTAFFDKRSKFVHYRPRTVVLNNLEFDHADIFPDLGAIETQFHHLVRTVPGSGRVIVNAGDAALARVLARGLWSERDEFDSAEGWAAVDHEQTPAANAFTVRRAGRALGRCSLQMPGAHSRSNALAAIAAAAHVGVSAAVSIEALARFGGVARRLESRGVVRGVEVIDDFAHHPSAIASTIDGLRDRIGAAGRILAVLEPRSNTMKLGVIKARLPESLRGADRAFVYSGGVSWDVAQALAPLGARLTCEGDLDRLVGAIVAEARDGDRILVMSNGGFGGIHQRLLAALDARRST
ncbi:MAG TPA: UDP-N-acetylmuramate:L-alanyl-gamma-D-glutamyl-meso-diaminopimelate ligase [Burkholderiaceae bacterium]